MAGKGQQPHVRWGNPPGVDIHQISDEELSTLESCGSHGWYETAGFSLLSIGSSFLYSVFGSDPKCSVSPITSVVATAGIVGGLVMLFVWFRSWKSSKTLAKEIRSRITAPIRSPWSP
jgi:hypothetical protein